MVDHRQSYYENTTNENNIGSQMGSVTFDTARSLFEGCEDVVGRYGHIPVSRGQIEMYRTNPLQVPPINRSNMTSHMSRTKMLETDPSILKYKQGAATNIMYTVNSFGDANVNEE